MFLTYVFATQCIYDRYDCTTLFSDSNNLAIYPPGLLFVNFDQPTWPEWYMRAFSNLAEHFLLNFDYPETHTSSKSSDDGYYSGNDRKASER
jgi:hypothetical protein